MIYKEISEILDLINNFKKEHKAIFITGTGTDIGKTFVSSEIVRILRENNVDAGYYKPILSGAIKEGNKLIPGDCKEVIDRSGMDEKPINLSTYVFFEAYSPHLAAEINGVNIDFDKIKNDYNRHVNKKEFLVVEGCGGIVCPILITDDKIILQEELIKHLELETILVTESDLGSINATITAFEYAKAVGIKVNSIIMNKFETNNLKHLDNYRIIKKMTECEIFVVS